MAAKHDKYPTKSKETYQYPSQFGSHAKMLDGAETEKLADPKLVVCKDDFGLYVTERNRLDDNLADPYRNQDQQKRNDYMQEIAGQVFDIVMHEVS